MSASDMMRRIWQEEEELPLSVLGRVGFVVSLLTMLCLVAAFLGLATKTGWPSGGMGFPLWCVIYGTGLVWSWWTMRPTASTGASHALVCGGLLLQAFTYLAMWAAMAVSAWDAAHGTMLPFIEQMDLLGLVVLLALFCVLCIGPLLGVMAPLSARRGLWMTGTQLFGMAGFLIMGMGAR